jgi:ketosteroid isomerase-like protein
MSIHISSQERFIERLNEAFLAGDEHHAAKLTESSNVQRLQEQYRAIARGDFGTLLDILAEDMEMELLGPADLPINGRWHGIAEVAAAVQRNFSVLDEQQAEILSVVAQGDTVVIHGQEHGKVRTTGKSYNVNWVQLFTFRRNKIIRMRSVSANVID